MSISDDELNSDIQKALDYLHQTRLQIWISDFEEAKILTDKCNTTLAEFVAFGYALKEKLNDIEKDLKNQQGINTKLKIGKIIREEHLNTDYLFAIELDRANKRYRDYIDEVLELENFDQLKPTIHESGFKYKLQDAGAERYEFRAMGKYELTPAIEQLFIDKIRALLTQNNIAPSEIRTVEKYPPTGDKLQLMAFRIFYLNTVTNLILLTDGTLIGDIQSREDATAKRLAEACLSALALTSASQD